jgi:hypothetical protein
MTVPFDAIDFIDEHLTGSKAKEAKQMVVAAWAETNPEEAAQYLEESKLTTGMRHSYVFNQIGRNWADKDPEAAMKWASDLGSSQQRSMAMSGILSNLDLEDPTRIESLLENIGNLNERKMRFGLLFRVMPEKILMPL